ncbi:MAG: metallophosphoesterase [Myxococcota bacterium]
MTTLAHLSDLHLGASAANERAAAALVAKLRETRVDHVVLTGDVTESGRIEEYELFLSLFLPLKREGRLTVVPGNHDRSGDDVAELLSDELRVSVDRRDGLFMVCVDSTAPHNRSLIRCHGELCERMLEAVDQALGLAPRGALVAVLLHHHVLPLPVESFGEWFADVCGWPNAAELPLGRKLLERVRGRCDLVLHGHRHVPRHFTVDGGRGRPLQVVNAGSSTALGAYRVFSHEAGRVEAVRWEHTALAPRPSPHLFSPAVSLRLGEAQATG